MKANGIEILTELNSTVRDIAKQKGRAILRGWGNPRRNPNPE
jgi:hypothetical protein